MHHALQNELISVMHNKMASRPGLLPASLLVTSASVCDAVISKSCSVCRFEMTEKCKWISQLFRILNSCGVWYNSQTTVYFK